MKEQQDSSSNTPPVPRCSSTGSAVPVKSETGSPGIGSIKQEMMMQGSSQALDSLQFNGHDSADLKPKLENGGDGGGEEGNSKGGELKPNNPANTFNTGPDTGPFSTGGGSGPPSVSIVTRPGRDSVTPSSVHRIQQIGPNGQPMGINSMPIGPNGQSMNVDLMPIGPNGQPMNVNSMPLGPSGQPMGMNSSMSMGGPRVLNVSGGPGPMQGSGAGHLQLSAGGHFMQLQNRIFVFSTDMANHAAEMVRLGQFKDIIDFHLSQPGIQQQLQKLAAQMQQCSSRNGGPMGMTVDGAMPPRTPLGGPGMPPQMINDEKSGGGGGGALANVAQWVQQQNINLQQERSGFTGPGPGAFCPDVGPIMKPNGRFGSVRSGSMPPGGEMDMGGSCPPPSYDVCGPGGMPSGFMHDPAQMPHPDLLHCKVPNENLTPEQLQRREEKMANMRKMRQMLFPDQQQGPNGPNSMMQPGQGGMMMHGGGRPPDGMSPDMWGPHGQQLLHPGMNCIGPGQCGPPDMMGGLPDDMGFGPSFMGGEGPMMRGMMPPPNWENMTPAERDWFKLQQEHYIEKCRKQQMQQMGQGPANRGNFMFNPMQQRIGMGGPMSPISPSMIGGGPGGQVISPRMGPDLTGGFPPSHPMCGPDIGGFDRGGPDRMFQFHDGEGMMGAGGRMGGSCPVDQFNPDMMMVGPGRCPPGHHNGPGIGGMMSKMPPGYGISAKRKRSAASVAADSDDVCKRLLPAPSPQQFSYVDPLEGQELIITKQENLAFQDQPQQQQSHPPSGSSSPPPSSSAPSYPPPPKSRQPASKKKKTKATTAATDDQHASRPKGNVKPMQTPPSSSSAAQSQQQQSSLIDNFTCPSPAISSISGAGAATPSLSNVASPVSQSGAVGSTATTSLPLQSGQNSARSLGSDTIKSSTSTNNPMANITSSSLADLARGVENLSQHIGMQSGGPFRTVQMQDNDSDMSNGSPLGGMPMASINSSLQMQQQMNSSMDMRGMMGGGPPPRGMNRTSSAGSMQQSSQQHLSELMFGSGSSSGGPMDEQAGMEPRGFSAFPGGPGPGGRSLNPYSSMGPSPGSSGSRIVNNSGGMVTGNAKIQIQAQAPNTIQYMPSNATMQSGPPQPGDNMNEPMMGGELIDSKSMGGGGGRGMGAAIKGMPFDMVQGGGGAGGGMSQAEMIHRQCQMDNHLMQEEQMMRAAELGGFGGPRPDQIHPGMMNMGMHLGAGPRSPMLGGSDGAMHRMHGGACSPMLGPGSPMTGPGGYMRSAHEMMHMQGPGGMMMRGGPPGGVGHMNDIPPHHMMPGGGSMGAQSEMGMIRPNMNAMMARGNMVSPGGMVSRNGAGNFMRGGGNPGGDPMMGMGPGSGGGMRPDMAMMGGIITGRGNDGGRITGGATMRGSGNVGGGKNEGGVASGPTALPGTEPRTKTGRRQSKKQQETAAAAAAAAAAATEARLRNEAASGRLSAGGMNPPSGGGGMDGEGAGCGVGMGIGGHRSGDMMGIGGPSGEQMMQGMMTSHGNAMSPEMMMMMQQQQRMSRGGMMMGGPGGGGDMMDGGGMDVMFGGFPPGRMHDSLDMCLPSMGGSPNIAQQGGSGGGDSMGRGGGYPSHQFQQFQQQLYAQNRSPPMNSSMQGMPMGPTDMMGRPIDNMGRVIDGIGRPNDVMGRVSDMMNRPMDMKGRPIDNMGRPIDGMSRSVDGMGRHMDSMSQLSDIMLRPMDRMGRPIDGMGRPIDGMGRPIDQMGRPMDGMIGSHPMDGMMGRPVDMMGRPMDNMGRPLDIMGGRPYDMMGNGPGTGPGNQVFGSSPPGLGPGRM